MKNFVEFQDAIQRFNIVDEVSTVAYAEWNLNRYIDGAIAVTDTLPTTTSFDDRQAELEQISKGFPVESILTPHRGNKSAYVIDGTNYTDQPRYINQRDRPDSSWQNDTTWLWHGRDLPYEYWVSPLKSNSSRNLIYDTGRIEYTWTQPVNMNKIRILFQTSHALPTAWTIALDLVGDKTWTTISTDPQIPADGDFVLYNNQSDVSPGNAGTWTTVTNRWSTTNQTQIVVYGVRVQITTVSLANGRPAIIELSPRLEADFSDLLVGWNVTEELADSDFISPIGTASANTGSVTLSNDLGTFNEHDPNSILHGLMDEEVLFTGYVVRGDEKVPVFKMFSDSWNVVDFDTCEVNLVDLSRPLQNMRCKDMIIPNVTVGSAFHHLFASLGLPQFNILETRISETPGLEMFYCKKEDTVWELIQAICKSLQVGAFFNSSGNLVLMTKEYAYPASSDATIDYRFNSEDAGTIKPDIFSLRKNESARFNKVIVRYQAINNFSLSGSRNQKMWTAPDPWTIGAAQIVRNISQGDTFFFIDPNRPEDLPRFSGKFVIEDFDRVYNYEGKEYYCKRGPEGSKRIIVDSPSMYWAAVENNQGDRPKFTGKVLLKDGETFHRNFAAKNYSFYQDWDLHEYGFEAVEGKAVSTGAKHIPVDGCLEVKTDFTGGRRLNVTKKQKNWNRFDRVGAKVKVKSNDSKFGIVVWPQGKNGASGYYFTIDPMSSREIARLIRSGEKEGDAVDRPSPKIEGFIVKGDGTRKQMDFDVAKDFKDISPLKIDKWSYLEVAVYDVAGGWEFEVFVNGQYCKTFTDTTVKLTRNERAGMTFMGNGVVMVDKFYVVNYPSGAIKSKDKDDSGFIVRRMDLWKDRKASEGDKTFEKYLQHMEKMKRTKVFQYDFSGRFHGIAREKVVENVRFEQPALTSQFKTSNKSVAVVDYVPSAFGAKVVLLNKSERSQLLKGAVETKVSGAERVMSSFIYGKSFRKADTQEITFKDQDMIDKLGPLIIEFDSEWIQDRDTANDLAKWVQSRFGLNAEIYEIDVFGNPLIEVGDCVAINWADKGLSDSQKWVVTRVSTGWSEGMETSLTVRRII